MSLMPGPKITLASKSERRQKILKEILDGLGLSFETLPAETGEISDGIYFKRAALANASLKAEAVAELRPDSYVTGADTVIETEGVILGKPRDLADAAAMLARLSGKEHLVVTAVCVINRSLKLKTVFAETSAVRFKKLTDAVINEYLSSVHVLDKAGSYAIQERGDLIVEAVRGSVDNVIGFPGARVREFFKLCAGLR